MLIIAGFWGFLMGCVIFPGAPWSWTTATFATIYGTPVTLSAMTFNILMGFAGGAIAAWVMTRDPFWMMSGALGGIISVAAGLDLYWPPMAFVIAMIGGVIMPIVARFVERMQIDDAVGAVALHGVVGVWGVVAVGVFASGYPALGTEGAPQITLYGQVIGAVVMAALGFIPGYAVSLLLKAMGLLRAPREAELMGLDKAKVPAVAYPELLGDVRVPTSPAE
jgi:ammonium transporter, Amt family